jgi:polysaccharide export outer membrane protein
LPLTNAALGDGYILGPGDQIRIEFTNVPEFSGEHRVLPNGTVNLTRVGAVSVQGLTLKQAADRLAIKFRPYLKRPLVTISLLAARPVRVAIAGEINRPGTYKFPAEELPTLTQLLQLAEGVTQAADLGQVQIRRRLPQGLGSDQVYRVDLWQLLQQGELAQDIALQDGDSIVIPATAEVDLATAQQLKTATFSPKSDRPLSIVVVGEVTRPGSYTAEVKSVTEAIQAAGGITQMADLRNIQVRRSTRSGQEQLITVNFWQLLQSGDAMQDLPLQDGDRIEVARATNLNPEEAIRIASASFSPDKVSVNVLGEVKSPGSVQVPPNTPSTRPSSLQADSIIEPSQVR